MASTDEIGLNDLDTSASAHLLGGGGGSQDNGASVSTESTAIKDDSAFGNDQRPQRFPRSVLLIVGNEFCERFNYYGMRAVLSLYLVNYLSYSQDQATTWIHVFTMLAYFFPIFGGVLSDTYLGKYRTILYLSLVYVTGSTLMAITAIPGVTGTPPSSWGVILSLLLIAVGTGGIKPCVSAFGGDQFKTSQGRQLESYFFMFYFAINLGSFLSQLITPILRGDVTCFGSDECFPLAFGVPAMLMILALGLFVAGSRWYIRRPPQAVRWLDRPRPGDALSRVAKVIVEALRRRWRAKTPAGAHWLDAAAPIYGARAVQEVRELLNVLTMFIPVPIFWTLFDQTASRWTFQAVSMDREVTVGGSTWIVKPDQMQMFNSIFVLLLIPTFDRLVYPLLRRLGLRMRPLQRMGAGMALTAISFVVTGFIQLSINQSTLGVIPNDPACDTNECCVADCVSVFTQVIPYFLLTCGEIMLSVTGLEFAYSQAPPSMKSVCQAAWLLTVAVGNLIMVLVSATSLFADRAVEYFFFAGCMAAVMLLFIFLARRYTYRSTDGDAAPPPASAAASSTSLSDRTD